MFEVVLVLIGIFYAGACIVVVRVGMMSILMDRMIAGIEARPVPRATRLRWIWLQANNLLVGAAGLLLVLLSSAAAPLFQIAAILQFFYVYYLAPVHLDPGDKPDETGRRQSRNAAYVYAAATLVVTIAAQQGVLRPWSAIPEAARWAVGVLVVIVLAWMGRQVYAVFGPSRRSESSGDAGRDADGAEDFDHDSGADGDRADYSRPGYAVMADYDCPAVWNTGPEYGPVDPATLGLSHALVADLAAWADEYQGSFDLENPGTPLWSEARYAEHETRGLGLARRLAAELAATGRGDVPVHWNPNGKPAVRVRADDPDSIAGPAAG